ncbi:PQQ-like beta-propeller repeat protein [Blastopirellula sp. JC732]|uniref:PQQ-like beta-propeller repeat protein n=1 Tax=Blastopirellula sediminis TaxID=2894196 RepID=A0A9X1MUD0_9BACT|nr:PQQ-binding-like beta-propeller repeat protein [Blastopirellula sediminis]MCC9604444.1 PQQ-like beta-propeller repeat protein [Blastopirellula sediminis]MCC9632257.1 PQQ-like beta-propeller repeat protein [Blastopirellula sediminis]
MKFRILPSLPTCGEPLRRIHLVALLMVTATAASVWGQVETNDDAVFLAPPREIRLQIERAREAKEAKKWTAAAEELGLLLNDPELEDFFLPGNVSGPVDMSIKKEARDLLNSLPKEGQEAFELLYGADAKAMLKQAISSRDPSMLAEISRRFAHTDAGYQATILLARSQLDQGLPMSAVLALQPLLNSRMALDKYEPEISLLMAIGYYAAGDEDHAVETLDNLRAIQKNLNFKVPQSLEPLFAESAKPGEWLSAQFQDLNSPSSKVPQSWVVFGGDAARNAPTKGSAPLRNLNWHVRMARSSNDEEQTEDTAQGFIENGIAVLPAAQPLVVRDQVLVRTPWHLLGVDLGTGKVKWNYPWDASDVSRVDSRFSAMSNDPGSSYLDQIKRRTWLDGCYGQISSDGERVFIIEEATPSEPQQRGPGIALFSVVRAPSPNRLRCFGLRGEGETLWIAGSEMSDEPALAEAQFLGVPLPVEGSLYTIAEVNGEIRLLVFNSADGKLLWSQQLAQLDGLWMSVNEPAHRRYGASPSFSDGVLICPTNIGVVAAIDVRQRSLLWGYQYQEVERQPRQGFIQRRPTESRQDYGDHWSDGKVVIAGNRVFLTPPETDQIFCLDRMSGKLLWEKPREDGVYLATVSGDIALVVGANNIYGLKVDTGDAAWESQPIPDGGLPSGRGFLSGDYYYLPTTQDEIVRINIRDGKLDKSIPTEGTLGNLVCHGRYVISQGVNFVASFKQIDALREEVRVRLAKNANDAEALRNQGELLVHDGKVQEALATLHRSLELVDSPETQQAYVSTALEALREDFAGNRDTAQKLESIVESMDDRLELVRVTAIGLHQAGEYQAAFNDYIRYVDLLDQIIDQGKSERPLQSIGPNLRVQRDRWIGGQLAQLRSAVDETVAASMNEAVAERWDGTKEHAKSDDYAEKLRRFARRFGAFPLARSAELELARVALANGNELAAETIWQQLAFGDDPQVAAQATADLAGLLAARGHKADASIVYRRLADRFRNEKLANGQSGRQLAMEQAVNVANPYWNYGAVNLDRRSEDLAAAVRLLHPIRIDERFGFDIPREALKLDNEERHIVVIDEYGNQRLHLPFTMLNEAQLYNSQTAQIHADRIGHLVIVSFGNEVHAFDTLQRGDDEDLRERALWQENLSPEGSSSRSRPKVNVVEVNDNPFGDYPYDGHDSLNERPIGYMSSLRYDSLCFQRGNKLICVDPLTGDSNWERDNVTPGCYLLSNDSVLAAIPPRKSNDGATETEALLFDLRSGVQIGTVKAPVREMIWATDGTNYLTWEKDDHQTVIARDLLTGKELWRYQGENGARGKVFGSQVAILEPNGQFHVFNLADGKKLIDAKLHDAPELGQRDSQIKIVEGADDFQLIVTTSRKESRFTSKSIPYNSKEPAGPVSRVYSFSRSDGQLQWQTPEPIRDFHLIEAEQSPRLPVLAFASRQNRIDKKAHEAIVLLVDRRDGRVLLRDGQTDHTATYQLFGDPENQTLRVLLTKMSFSLNFTAAPAPPAPSGSSLPAITYPPVEEKR